jgi:hypothetical protein
MNGDKDGIAMTNETEAKLSQGGPYREAKRYAMGKNYDKPDGSERHLKIMREALLKYLREKENA